MFEASEVKDSKSTASRDWNDFLIRLKIGLKADNRTENLQSERYRGAQTLTLWKKPTFDIWLDFSYLNKIIYLCRLRWQRESQLPKSLLKTFYYSYSVSKLCQVSLQSFITPHHTKIWVYILVSRSDVELVKAWVLATFVFINLVLNEKIVPSRLEITNTGIAFAD